MPASSFERLLWAAFEEAAPYLSDIEWMRTIVTTASKLEDVNEAKDILEKTLRSEGEHARRNDVGIFLMYLSKYVNAGSP